MSGRLNWNRSRRVFTAWYDRDTLPWNERLRPTAQAPRPTPRPKRPKPAVKDVSAKSVAVTADAFAGKPLLRTHDLFEAREALYEAKEAIAYCDGSASPNPGEMSIGVVILVGGARVEMYASLGIGTNNLAELAAAHMAIEALPAGCKVRVISDSEYLIRGATVWAQSRAKKFRCGAVVKNADMWRALDTLNARRSISWEWVRGHGSNPGNRLADRLATLGRAQP